MKSRFVKKLAASAIAAAMVATMVPMTALADKDTGLESVALTKNFQIAAGLTVPEGTQFDFKIRQTDGTEDGDPQAADIVSESGAAIAAAADGHYYLKDVSFTYKEDDRNGTEDEVLTKQQTLFAGVTYPKNETVYYFQVTEVVPDTVPEGWTYDKDAKYYVTVTVDAGGKATYTVATDDRNEDTTGGKIDATPQTETNDSDGGTDGNGDSGDVKPNEFVFTNSYAKDVTSAEDRDTTENSPADPRDDDAEDDPYDPDTDPDPIGGNNDQDGKGGNAAFTLKKVIKNAKSAGDTFTFTLNVTYPITADKTATYATLLNGAAGTALKNGENTVTLGNNGVFEVEKLPAGTKIEVTEAGTTGYTPKSVISYNGSTGEDKTGDRSASLEAKVLVGERGGYVSFINDYSSASPTGILMTNLPFTLLILVALVGFAGYIYSQRRRAAMNDII